MLPPWRWLLLLPGLILTRHSFGEREKGGMLSTPLPALVGAVTLRVRGKRGEEEMLGDRGIHPQHELPQTPSPQDGGSIPAPGEGRRSTSACGEAVEVPRDGGPPGLAGCRRGPSSPPGAPAAWEAGTV